MKVLFASSECVPFLKVGGLGDVVYSLSKEEVKHHVETYVVLPLYDGIEEKYQLSKVSAFEVKMNWRHLNCEIYYLNYHRVHFYFISNNYYFKGRKNPYGYQDDQERFAFYQLSLCHLIKNFGLEIDVIHLNDWQTGMIPLIYQTQFKHSFVKEPKFLLTIHNPAFLGYVQRNDLYDYFNIDPLYFDNGLTRFNHQVSYLKTGIMLADYINSVSPHHVEELLSGVIDNDISSVLNLRKEHFIGIVNGIDEEEFDPRHDPYIYKTYNLKNVFSEKKQNRDQFYQTYHFDHDYPLFSVVSRLTSQKGIDLICQGIDEMMKMQMNLFILGTGEAPLEQALLSCEQKYPGRIKVLLKYDNQISHQVYASSDFFLMPSLFEPCGISQMIALKYGTLPLARSVGGLVDTIDPFLSREHHGDGFLFEPYCSNELIKTISLALYVYQDQEIYHQMVLEAMKKDSSWKKSTLAYISLYQQMMK